MYVCIMYMCMYVHPAGFRGAADKLHDCIEVGFQWLGMGTQ